MISSEKYHALENLMKKLGVLSEDLVEKFITGSGKGGQKINKTASCVYLKHIPTGIEVKCQKTRSREENRFFARRLLCEKIEYILHPQSKIQSKINKIRKQKKRLKRRSNSTLPPSEK